MHVIRAIVSGAGLNIWLSPQAIDGKSAFDETVADCQFPRFHLCFQCCRLPFDSSLSLIRSRLRSLFYG